MRPINISAAAAPTSTTAISSDEADAAAVAAGPGAVDRRAAMRLGRLLPRHGWPATSLRFRAAPNAISVPHAVNRRKGSTLQSRRSRAPAAARLSRMT